MKYDENLFDRDSEEGKVITYLDNATIINACSILANPQKFDVYKLLDLESFCEAFLLFDCVRTLVGCSFASGFSAGYQFPEDSWESPKDFSRAIWVSPKNREKRSRRQFCDASDSAEERTGTLYDDLINQGLLRPVVLGAGTVHYHIERLELLDEISNSINVDQAVNLVQRIFEGSIPWTYPLKEESSQRGSNPESFAWRNLVIGEDTWTSDSYPIYHFSVPKSDRKKKDAKNNDFCWELTNNRKTEWVESFVSQTFFYVAEASLHKKPYLCSSIRVPIVHDMVAQINGKFLSVVHGSLGSVSQQTRKKIETVLHFFDNGAIHSLFLPVLFCVLREASSRKDIIPTLLSMRNREDIVNFRKWCRSLELAWKEQNLDLIYYSIQELQSISEHLSESIAAEPLQGSMFYVPDVNLLTQEGFTSARESEEKLVSSCYNPSLAILKDIGAYASAIGQNFSLIEDLLEHKLDEFDKNIISQLQAQRDTLYSPGKIFQKSRTVQVNKTEVTMGEIYNVGQAGAVGKYARSDNNTFVQSEGKKTLAEAAMEIQQLLKQLEQTNPNATETEKVTYVNDETTPSFKRRVVGALQSGSEAAIEEFLDNPYVNVGKAIVKGWIKPE
jgi:hypothetical protein